MKKKSPESCGAAEVWFQMMRTHRAIDRALSAVVAAEGLTIPQTEILAMLIKKGPLPQQALADGLCVTKGNVAQVIDRLARSGLLTRTEMAGDRRANLLAITPLGLEKTKEILPRFVAFLETLFAQIPAERSQTLIHELMLLEQAAKHVD